jgi:hypothetical protein
LKTESCSGKYDSDQKFELLGLLEKYLKNHKMLVEDYYFRWTEGKT